MATNATRTQSTTAATAAMQTALAEEQAMRRAQASAPGSAEDLARKASGYGLPCAKCHLYYPADLDICPTCRHHERVSPVVPRVPARVAQASPETIPDTTVVEQEREEFLRQFKSQLMEAHADVVSAPESFCTADRHTGDPGVAEVCKGCYEHLQERLDVCEAGLHMDLKEAAQIIYDAVWADPSDPNKTYQNAANALLTELRKRSGMNNSLRGPFHPLEH
jgi:hypothetical protein